MDVLEARQAEDQHLLARIAEKDETALSAFYDRYRRLVYALVLRIVGDECGAEEVLGEVFWQVWRQAERYSQSRGKAVAWLMTIARTRAIDLVRRNKRQRSVAQPVEDEIEDESGSPVDDVLAEELRGQVRAALRSLPAAQQTAIELAYYNGLSQSQIATALSQPLGTVKTRIRSGLARLRKDLQDYA